MKSLKQIAAAAVSAVMALTAITFQIPELPASAATDAITLVEDMGMGWNLGNTFDSAPVKGWVETDPYVNTERGWGNPITTKAMIDTIAASGFKSVRIPITWFENMDDSGTVNTAYLARIKEVVDWCIADGMKVIINIHHDGASEGANATSNATKATINGAWLWQGTSQKAKFTNLWKQIADYFKSYDNDLIFAGWNEISWDYNVELEMAQAFVDTVRATGGNNASRLLVIPANNTSLDAALSSSFQLPTDSADMLAVEIHYYSPPNFSIRPATANWGTEVNTWGSTAEINEMKNDINKMYQAFAAKGVPVIIGESGVITNEKREAASIESWIQTLFSTALGFDGICPILWDSSNCGDMQYFDRNSLVWFDSVIGDNFKKMTGTATNTVTSVTYDAASISVSYDDDGNAVANDTGEFPYLIDIKPYKDIAKINGVMIKGHGTGAGADPCFGVTVAFNGYLGDKEPFDTPSEYKWMYQQVSYGFKLESYQFMFGSEKIMYNNADDEAVEAGEFGKDWNLSYDYIQLQSWWANNCKDYVLDSVTVLFESPVVLDGTDPAETTAAPVETTAAPVETTAAPVETTAAPVETTVAPVETTTTAVETTAEPAGPTEALWGDADESGLVDVSDAVLVARYSVEDKEAIITEKGLALADVTHDGGVKGDDAVKIVRYVAQLITKEDLAKA